MMKEHKLYIHSLLYMYFSIIVAKYVGTRRTTEEQTYVNIIHPIMMQGDQCKMNFRQPKS